LNDYTTYSDEQLITLLKDSDVKAFDTLYHKYWKFLYSVSYKKLQNSEDAKEIVQDIFLDVWNRRNAISLTSNLSSYLSVATNYRVLRILAQREIHSRYEKNQLELVPQFVLPEDLLSFEEIRLKLEHLVAALPEKCRMVFLLSRNNKMTGRQISEHMAISEKTVEAHLTKALRRLKTGLGLLFLIWLAIYAV
jgi:RNA polymerase sigma-70 factor (family 1)